MGGVFVAGHSAGLPDLVLHQVCSIEWMCTELAVATGTSGSGAGYLDKEWWALTKSGTHECSVVLLG